jgi:hypothetical protein
MPPEIRNLARKRRSDRWTLSDESILCYHVSKFFNKRDPDYNCLFSLIQEASFVGHYWDDALDEIAEMTKFDREYYLAPLRLHVLLWTAYEIRLFMIKLSQFYSPGQFTEKRGFWAFSKCCEEARIAYPGFRILLMGEDYLKLMSEVGKRYGIYVPIYWKTVPTFRRWDRFIMGQDDELFAEMRQGGRR